MHHLAHRKWIMGQFPRKHHQPNIEENLLMTAHGVAFILPRFESQMGATCHTMMNVPKVHTVVNVNKGKVQSPGGLMLLVILGK